MNPQPTQDARALRNSAIDFNTAWGVTMPAQLDAVALQSGPYSEPIRGLVTREVHEPEVFKLFFG